MKNMEDDGNDFDLSLEDIFANIEVKGSQTLSSVDLLNLIKDENHEIFKFTLEAKRQKAQLPSFSNVLWKDIWTAGIWDVASI